MHMYLAEDDLMMRTMVSTTIRGLGVGKLTVARDGQECLALIEKAGIPDLFMLDVNMPNMDGYETCRALRSIPDCRDVPIIFGAGLDQPRACHRCFEVGGTDLIHKPYFIPELRARLRVHLERISMTRSLRAFHRRMEDALQAAGAMQRSLMPGDGDLDLGAPGLSFDWMFEPAESIGGDLWCVEPLGDGRIFVTLLDVCGHGLIAAINAFRVHGLFSRLAGQRATPGAWLSSLNTIMARDFRCEVFATGLCGVLDCEAGTFTYASAGSPRPLMGRRLVDGRWGIQVLPSSGFMLGMVAAARYPARRIPFRQDQFLFLYSDGAIRTSEGSEMDDRTLSALLRSCVECGDPSPLSALSAALPGMTHHHDDVVMLWFAHRLGADAYT